MSKRTFIVAPTEAGKDLGDTLHQVCQTEGKGCYFDIYQADDYEVVDSFPSLDGAKAACRRLGCERPFVLA